MADLNTDPKGIGKINKEFFEAAPGVALDRVQFQNSDHPPTIKQLFEYFETRFSPGLNLFDASRTILNKYANPSTGLLQTSDYYHASPFFVVTPETLYYFNYNNVVQWFDADLVFLSGVASGVASTGVATEYLSPAGAYYARLSADLGTQLKLLFCELAKKEDYETYEESIPISAIPRSIRPDITEIFTELTDVTELQNLGGELLSGALGGTPGIKIPFEFKRPTVIEFDFQIPFDLHENLGDLVLASINKEGATDAPLIKIGFLSATPTASNYTSTYTTELYQALRVSALQKTNVSSLDRCFNGSESFSIRIVSPTITDINTEIAVLSDQVKVFSGETTIGSWLFATYSTIADIVAAMSSDLGASYEVKLYCNGELPSSSLAIFKANLCKSQLEFDIANNQETAVTIYDSYQTFVNVINTSVWHTAQIVIYTRDVNTTYAYTTIDNCIKVGTYYANPESSGMLQQKRRYELYIGSTSDGASTPLFPVRNLRISHPYERQQHNMIAVMCHNFIDGPETDGSGTALTVSSGRLRRFFDSAKNLGWSFVAMPDYLDMVQGNTPVRDKIIVMITDDSNFGWYQQDDCRKAHAQHNIKQTTAIMTASFNFSTNADLMHMLVKNGNYLAYHCDNHVDYSKLSYDQFITSISNSDEAFALAHQTTNVLVYSNGGYTQAQVNWYRNNGFAAGFAVGGGGQVKFGVNPFTVVRTAVDDTNVFSTAILPKLTITAY